MSHQNSSPLGPGPVANGTVVAAPGRVLQLEVWGATDKGRAREGNEDAIYPANIGTSPVSFKPGPEKWAQCGQLLIVADGVGGSKAGRESSHWAIRVAVERYYDAPGVDLLADLQSAVSTANASLFQYLQSLNTSQAGTTMVAAVIHHNRLYYVNAGDSRAYLIREGNFYRLTRDHTLVQQKLDAGILTPEAAELDPERNVITRSLGAAPQIQVDAFPPLELQPGDVVLLCSDGLTDMVAEADLPRLIGAQSPRQAARKLIAAANRAGGADNISVVLARVGGKPHGKNGAGALSKSLGLESLRADWFKMRRGQRLALSLLAALVILTVMLICGIIGWNLVEPKNGDNGTVVDPTPAVTAPAPETPEEATPLPEATLTEAEIQNGTPRPPTSTPRPTATPTPTPTPRGWRPTTTTPPQTGGELPTPETPTPTSDTLPPQEPATPIPDPPTPTKEPPPP